MAGNFSIRKGGFVLACMGGIFAMAAGFAEAGGGVARGGASVSVENQFRSQTGANYVMPFSLVEFEVELTNIGGANPVGSYFNFSVPAGLTAMTWSCAPVQAAACSATVGEGPVVNQPIDSLGPGGSIVYSVRAQQFAEVPPYITGTASVLIEAGASTVCSDGQTSPCTSIVSVPTGANFTTSLSGQRTGQGTARFEFSARHSSGSRSAENTRIFSEVPAGVQTYTWTCAAFGTSTSCPAASGSGDIDQIVTFWGDGDEIVYTIDAVLAQGVTDDVSASVLVTPPGGGSCGNEAVAPPCIAIEVLPAMPRINVSKDAELTNEGNIAYTVVVSNPGDSSTSLIINDPTPAGLDDLIDFQCAATGMTECPGVDPRLDFLEASLPPGGSLTFTFVGVLDQVTLLPSITNTVTVEIPSGGLCNADLSVPPCVASVTTGLGGPLRVTKTTDAVSAVPGELITYEINVQNESSDVAANMILIRDEAGDGIDAFESWTCTSTVAGECPASSGSGDLFEDVSVLSPGAMLTYSIQARVAQSVPMFVVNTATVSAEVGGFVCADGTAQPCVAQVTIPSAIVYSVSKTADGSQLGSGQINYELRILKSGGVTGDVRILDTMPAGISAFSWTCSSATAFCAQDSGTGSIDMTLAEVPPGDVEFVFAVEATLAQVLPAQIVNTLTVTPPGTSLCVSGGVATQPPCTATATTQIAQSLSITKTANEMQLLRGGFANYLVTVTNEGVGVGEVSVRDAQAAGLASMEWQCTGYFGVTCPAASGTGSFDLTFNSFPANGRAEFNVLGGVALNAPASITNVATLVPPSVATCVPASCAAEVTLPVVNSPAPNFSLALSANVNQLAPSQAVVYTLDVRNLGEIPAKGASLNIPLPAGLASFTWTCAGDQCPVPSGSGAIAQTIPFLPVYSPLGGQGSLLYTITASVSVTPPAFIGLSATIVPNGLGSCVGGNCTVSLSLPTVGSTAAVIDLTMTADRAQVAAGGSVGYEVTLSNEGSVDAGPIVFSNPLAAGLSGIVWQCRGVNDAQCPQANGAGAINQTLTGIPANSALLYTISANVLATATSSIVNLATLTPSSGTTCNPSSCRVSVATAINVATHADIALRNPRPYSAAGINGTLIDVVNLSAITANAIPVRLTPASARRLLATFASGCTATTGSAGSVTVNCPNPGIAQGVRCLDGVCTIDQLAQNAAVTLFVALNDGATATLRAEAAGDPNSDNNAIVLPTGATP